MADLHICRPYLTPFEPLSRLCISVLFALFSQIKKSAKCAVFWRISTQFPVECNWRLFTTTGGTHLRMDGLLRWNQWDKLLWFCTHHGCGDRSSCSTNTLQDYCSRTRQETLLTHTRYSTRVRNIVSIIWPMNDLHSIFSGNHLHQPIWEGPVFSLQLIFHKGFYRWPSLVFPEVKLSLDCAHTFHQAGESHFRQFIHKKSKKLHIHKFYSTKDS